MLKAIISSGAIISSNAPPRPVIRPLGYDWKMGVGLVGALVSWI